MWHGKIFLQVQSLGQTPRGKYPYFRRYPNSLTIQCMISQSSLYAKNEFDPFGRFDTILASDGQTELRSKCGSQNFSFYFASKEGCNLCKVLRSIFVSVCLCLSTHIWRVALVCDVLINFQRIRQHEPRCLTRIQWKVVRWCNG